MRRGVPEHEGETWKMDAYTGFASVYDQFMEDVPYEQWRDIIIEDERVIIRTKLEKPSKIKGLALI